MSLTVRKGYSEETYPDATHFEVDSDGYLFVYEKIDEEEFTIAVYVEGSWSSAFNSDSNRTSS